MKVVTPQQKLENFVKAAKYLSDVCQADIMNLYLGMADDKSISNVKHYIKAVKHFLKMWNVFKSKSYEDDKLRTKINEFHDIVYKKFSDTIVNLEFALDDLWS